MKPHYSRYPSHPHNSRILYWLLLGIVVLAGIFLYVNKYIYRFRAAYPQISATLSAPSIVNKDVNQEFTVSLNVSGQQILAGDVVLIYDPAQVQYSKDYAPGSGVSNVDTVTNQPFFSPPLLVETNLIPGSSNERLRTVLVSTYTNPTNPNWTTNASINFKFRAIGNGQTVIRLDTTSKFAGVSGGNATFFDLPPALPQATVTLTGTGTITPTIGQTTPTTVISPNPTQTTSIPTRTITPTPNPKKNISLDLTILFQGITDYPKDRSRRMDVEVFIKSTDGKVTMNNTQSFDAQGAGLWNGVVDFNQVDISKDYTVLIKGPKHLKKRICEDNPSESTPGGYNCSLGVITFTGGTNVLDFSGIILLAGDIPVQNGLIDALDITFVRQNLGKTDRATLEKGDINLDGIVDTQDYALILAALRFKYDEE